MKALVTGGSGFIGSTLIEALSKRGVDVDVIMRKTSSDKNLKGLSYHRVEGDIEDFDSLRRAVDARKEIDVVFHLAGLVAAKDRASYFRANSDGTENLARAVSDANKAGAKVKRVVYISTLAAGGPATSIEGRKESDPDAPLSAYGASKRAGEDGLLRYADSFRPVIVRPPIVYGPKDPVTLVLIKTVAKRIVPKFPRKTLDGEKYFSVIHVNDFVEAIIAVGLAKDSQFSHGEVFYACSGETITDSKLMGVMAEGLGVKPIVVSVPLPVLKMIGKIGDIAGKILGKATVVNSDKVNEARVDFWTCQNKKLMEKMGWRSSVVFDQGMKEAITWYQQNGWL